MNFEDIVDMEWVDTNTQTVDESNEFSDLYFNQQLLPPTVVEPQIKLDSLGSMPSTEQIKQLIEIAKQQLVLREQLQELLQPQQQQQQNLLQFLSPNSTEVQTAAPSTIFAPPPPPMDNTPLIPSIVTSTDTIPTEIKPRRDSIASAEESISLEAYAEADGIDLKKLSPKERRQLRNKISARNFRVRRKEYISTLEGQVNEQKQITEGLQEKLLKAEDENKQLRKEMDTLKKQNQLLQQQRTLPKPNLNKDISILGTKATDSYRQQDNCILVSSAVMPVWDYQAILEKPIQPLSDDDDMNKLAGQFILSVVQLANTMPRGTNQIGETSLADRDFTSSHNSTALYPSSFNMEDLYDILIQSALTNNASADKSFLWQQ